MEVDVWLAIKIAGFVPILTHFGPFKTLFESLHTFGHQRGNIFSKHILPTYLPQNFMYLKTFGIGLDTPPPPPLFGQCPKVSNFLGCLPLGWLWTGNCKPVNFSFMVQRHTVFLSSFSPTPLTFQILTFGLTKPLMKISPRNCWD